MTKFLSLTLALGFTCAGTFGLYEIFKIDILLAWFIMVNIILFLLMTKDKSAAKTGMRRTPERTLLTLAVAGGFPALFVARKILNHKTSKKQFIVMMWVLFGAQVAAVGYFYLTPERLGLTPKNTAQTTVQQPVQGR